MDQMGPLILGPPGSGTVRKGEALQTTCSASPIRRTTKDIWNITKWKQLYAKCGIKSILKVQNIAQRRNTKAKPIK
jgi:hypothetical protein